MTFEGYRKAYGYSKRDLTRYLDRGMIQGAVKKGGDWLIPEGVRPDWYVRKRKKRTVEDDAYDVLKALNSRRAIRAELLLCTVAEYELLMDQLVSVGWISMAENGGYSITPEGIQELSEKKARFTEVYRQTVAAVAEGATAATLGECGAS